MDLQDIDGPNVGDLRDALAELLLDLIHAVKDELDSGDITPPAAFRLASLANDAMRRGQEFYERGLELVEAAGDNVRETERRCRDLIERVRAGT